MSGQAIDEVRIAKDMGIQDLKSTPKGQKKVMAIIELVTKRSPVLFVCRILYAYAIIESTYWFWSCCQVCQLGISESYPGFVH